MSPVVWDNAASRAFYDTELRQRANRAVDKQRLAQIDWFTHECLKRDLSTVIEVGAGAGRDGRLLEAGGLTYTGVDLSKTGVEICRGRGSNAVVAPATRLPFRDNSFDAGWTMSTLMHVPDNDFAVALNELHRVLRPGALLAVGVWGSTRAGERVDEHGRLFKQHTDDQVRAHSPRDR